MSAHGSRRWGQPTARPFDALGAALLVAGPMAAVGRQRFPSAVLVVAVAAAVAYLGAGYPFDPVFLAPLVALCSAVLSGRRGAAYVTTAVAVLALTAVHMLRN